MSDRLKKRLGIVGVVAGAVLLIGGTLLAHFTALPATDAIGQRIYPSIPRCLWFEEAGSCWILPTLAQSTAFLGSQVLMAGIVIGWIFDRKMTWALATIGAFLFTLEVIILFGIVPNEMLALFQGRLEWSSRRIFLTIPPWLVLNNTVQISYDTLKDLVVAGYATTMLVLFMVVPYQVQEWSKRRGEPKPPTTSLYGRPVVKGTR
ncbi:MAG TPA: hypothetical protein VMM81_07950 [Acidimicrobiia bacterium]|nr:hypothetical protein [Acidimicrobiia bacterium]